MDRKETLRLLEKYQQGECTKKEKKLVEDFLSSYQSSNEWIDWKHGNKNEVGDRIYEGIMTNISEQESVTSRRSNLFSYKYIGGILLLAACSIFWLEYGRYLKEIPSQENKWITKTTQRGQKANIVLGDGTFIRLNSESDITYPSKFDQDTREVTLIGEAYFEVTKDSLRPFFVKSGELITSVLGTAFNVKAYPDKDMEVTVSSGKVRVETWRSSQDLPNKKIYLTPNQQVSYDPLKHIMTKKEVDINQFLAWRNDHIILNKVSMKEATSILERWFNVDIVIENKAIEHCIIRSEYKNESLINILESMKFILDIDYRFEENNQVVISGESCKNY